MSRRSHWIRLASWLAVSAILLRAAVPLLAVGAAQWRGVAVGSVCTVYGVVLSRSGGGAHAGHAHGHADHPGQGDHSPGSEEAHTGDHCALTALAELGVSDAPAVRVPFDGRYALDAAATAASHPWGDASATWVARRKQGPPSEA